MEVHAAQSSDLESCPGLAPANQLASAKAIQRKSPRHAAPNWALALALVGGDGTLSALGHAAAAPEVIEAKSGEAEAMGALACFGAALFSSLITLGCTHCFCPPRPPRVCCCPMNNKFIYFWEPLSSVPARVVPSDAITGVRLPPFPLPNARQKV